MKVAPPGRARRHPSARAARSGAGTAGSRHGRARGTAKRGVEGLTAIELGLPLARADASLLGVYTHLYETNFARVPGISTHYVVLAYRLDLNLNLEALPRTQHSSYRWWARDEAFASGQVHSNTHPYFVSDSGV